MERRATEHAASAFVRRAVAHDGERCVPGESGTETTYEHIHRYQFVAAMASGRDVIDVGSGEGYGAAMLARTARSVTGVDVDEPAIAYSSKTYQAPNLVFRRSSALGLDGCADASFDVAVCFEMIEHVAEHDQLLDSILRVLRPGGVLVISSPDRDVYTTHEHHNPFHVRELDRREFHSLLRSRFRSVGLFTQTFTVGSLITAIDAADPGGALGFSGHLDGATWISHDDEPRPYLVAVASDRPLPPLPSISHLHDSERRFQADALGWRAEAAQRSDEAAALRAEVERQRREIKRQREDLESITRSRGWRMLMMGYRLLPSYRRAHLNEDPQPWDRRE